MKHTHLWSDPRVASGLLSSALTIIQMTWGIRMRVSFALAVALGIFSFSSVLAFTVSGTVFLDANFNGMNDAETGQGGVTVNVFDSMSFIGTGMTSFDGTFSVSSGQPGTDVRVEFELGPLISGPFGADSGTTVIFAQSGDFPVDLGILSSGVGSSIELGNRVWHDSDGDGIQDPGEPMLPSVTVELYEGVMLRGTTVTDVNGQYLFNDSNTTFPIGTIPMSTALELRVAAADLNLLGGIATIANAGTDLHDSDGVLMADFIIIAFTTEGVGESNHTHDFGFIDVIVETPIFADGFEAGDLAGQYFQ